MKKQKRMRRIATLLATVLLVALMAVPASAAATQSSYGDGVDAQNVKFNKILVIRKGDAVPNIEFGYEVSVPTAKIDAIEGTSLEVLPGIGTPTIAAVTFSSNDTADQTTAITNNTDYDTVTKDITIDFSGIKFTEPGVYRYYIYEKGDSTGHDTAGVVYDVAEGSLTTAGDRYRTLDVYVEDNTSTDLGLKITGYVLYDGKVTVAPSVPGAGETPAASGTAITSEYTIGEPAANSESRIANVEKTDNIMNYYDAYNVTISKTVAGNQGSKDKYFEFTFTVTGATPGLVYQVNLDNAVISPTDTAATTVTLADNPTEITVDNSGAATATFYLQHGQSIEVLGMARGTVYSVTENNEDYTPSIVVTEEGNPATSVTVTDNKTASDAGITEATTIAFTNTKDGIIPTGILLSATPWIILGLVVVAGIVFFAIRSKKKYEEE